MILNSTTNKLYLIDYFKNHYDILIIIVIASIISSLFALSQSTLKVIFAYNVVNFLVGTIIGISVGFYLDLQVPESNLSIIGAILGGSNGTTLLKTIIMLLPKTINIYIQKRLKTENDDFIQYCTKNTYKRNTKRSNRKYHPKNSKKKN